MENPSLPPPLGRSYLGAHEGEQRAIKVLSKSLLILAQNAALGFASKGNSVPRMPGFRDNKQSCSWPAEIAPAIPMA